MEIQYIFCINPGRSGSKYLSELFRGHSEVASHHEQPPIMNREPMRRWLKDDKTMMQDLVPEKLQRIHDLKGEKPVYLESNHCFIKGFGWEIIQHLPQEKVLVLVLKREKEDVVASHYRIRCTPVNWFGSEWLIQPARKGIAKVSAPAYAFFRAMHYFDYYYTKVNYKLGKKLPDLLKPYKLKLLRRYYDLTYRLGEGFFEKFPTVRRMDISLKDLNDPEWVAAFCNNLGIAFTPAMQEKLGIKVNERRGVIHTPHLETETPPSSE